MSYYYDPYNFYYDFSLYQYRYSGCFRTSDTVDVNKHFLST